MGSLVGALTSILTTYVSQRSQSRRDFLNKQFAQRETLYCEFINEAARLFADSLKASHKPSIGPNRYSTREEQVMILYHYHAEVRESVQHSPHIRTLSDYPLDERSTDYTDLRT